MEVTSSPAAVADAAPGVLTARQQMVLDFIAEHLQDHGYPPTIREIGTSLGVRSTNAVFEMLAALERKGWIDRDSKSSRGMRLRGATAAAARPARVTVADDAPEAAASDAAAEVVALRPSAPSRRGRSVAILGKVAAGVPIEAVASEDDGLILDERLTGGGDVFALRVVGRSMVDAGILPDDLVLVEPTRRVANGAIAVVDLDGEVTVKRLYVDATGARLLPENREMAPIFLDAEASHRLRVIGSVRGVVRALA